MLFLTRLLGTLFFFFVVFGLQAAHAFSFFGIQPNVFLICAAALTLFIPRTGEWFLFLLSFQACFLILLFFFFPFFLLETAAFFLLLTLLFWARIFSSGTFGADFFIFLFILFFYFLLLGIRHVSFSFFLISLAHLFATLGVAFLFLFLFFHAKKRISF